MSVTLGLIYLSETKKSIWQVFSSFPQFWCSPSNILCSLPSAENWKIKKETLFNDGDKTSLMQLVGIYNCNLHRNFELAKTVAIESFWLPICNWFFKFSSLKYWFWWAVFFPSFKRILLSAVTCKIPVWNRLKIKFI